MRQLSQAQFWKIAMSSTLGCKYVEQVTKQGTLKMASFFGTVVGTFVLYNMGSIHPSPRQSHNQQQAASWRPNKLSTLRQVKFQRYKLFTLQIRIRAWARLRRYFNGRRLIGNGCRLKQETFAFTKTMDHSGDKMASVSTCQICRNICIWLVGISRSDI